MTDAKQKMPELLPCPFCGGAATTTHHSNSFEGKRLMSVGCCAYVMTYEPECYERWNTRTHVEEINGEMLSALKIAVALVKLFYISAMGKSYAAWEEFQRSNPDIRKVTAILTKADSLRNAGGNNG